MSPEAVAVKLTGVPTIPVVGAVVKVRTNGVPVIVILVVAVASLAPLSVTLTVTVKVPLTLYVCDWVFGLVAPPATFAVLSPKLQLNE